MKLSSLHFRSAGIYAAMNLRPAWSAAITFRRQPRDRRLQGAPPKLMLACRLYQQQGGFLACRSHTLRCVAPTAAMLAATAAALSGERLSFVSS